MENLLAYNKLSKLPSELQSEVMDFIDFLLSKEKDKQPPAKAKSVSGKGMFKEHPDFDEPSEDFKEYIAYSEKNLAKDWLTTQEDEVWRDL